MYFEITTDTVFQGFACRYNIVGRQIHFTINYYIGSDTLQQV